MHGFFKGKIKKAVGALQQALQEGLGGGGDDEGGGGVATGGGGGGGKAGASCCADPFTHPGMLMGPREVALLRERIRSGQQPWARAADKLASETPRQIWTHALARVHIDFDGVGVGHDQLVETDSKMVYMQAMMWIVTGDEQYARNAAGIIFAWSTINRCFEGQNAPLEAGWGVDSMARSAELLKHTWPGWTRRVENYFLDWVDRFIMPQLRSSSLARLPLGNWHSTIAECKAQLAILRGDAALFDEAVADWRRVLAAYIYPSGECAETKRDLYHSQFGLGGLVQLAEVAWQQGLDLYGTDDCKLCRAMEFHAFITNGGRPPECCYPLRGIGFLPCGWEVALNHYKGRWGMSMPETEKLLAANRPEGYVFHWGLGTLSHYGTAEAVCPGPPEEERRQQQQHHQQQQQQQQQKQQQLQLR